MRTRVLFTVLTVVGAGLLGTVAGAALDDFGHAYAVAAVLMLGVLTIGLLDGDPARSAETVV